MFFDDPRRDSSAGTPRETERVADEPRPRRAREGDLLRRSEAAVGAEGGAFGSAPSRRFFFSTPRAGRKVALDGGFC